MINLYYFHYHIKGRRKLLFVDFFKQLITNTILFVSMQSNIYLFVVVFFPFYIKDNLLTLIYKFFATTTTGKLSLTMILDQ